jgi:hypothetical protein
MSTPAADGGAIQNFVRSLYSGHFYASAPHLGLKVGFRNLLLLAFILGLVTATQWSSAVGEGMEEWRARVEDGSMPAMLLDKGRLSVRGPQPFVRRESNGGITIIDTTGTYAGVPDSIPGGLFIGPGHAVFKSGPEMSRTYQFRGQTLGFWLDGPGIGRVRGMVIPAVLVIGTLMAFVYYFAVNTLLSLLLAVVGLVLMRAFAPVVRYRYAQVLTVMLFVVTPVAILFRFFGLVSPELAVRLLPFYPALAASLLFAALRASIVPPEGPPGGPDPRG